MKDFENYVSDHFIGRPKWIEAKIGTELATGKHEVNGIYITEERLIEKIPDPEYDVMDRSVDAINQLSASVNTNSLSDTGIRPFSDGMTGTPEIVS